MKYTRKILIFTKNCFLDIEIEFEYFFNYSFILTWKSLLAHSISPPAGISKCIWGSSKNGATAKMNGNKIWMNVAKNAIPQFQIWEFRFN